MEGTIESNNHPLLSRGLMSIKTFTQLGVEYTLLTEPDQNDEHFVMRNNEVLYRINFALNVISIPESMGSNDYIDVAYLSWSGDFQMNLNEYGNENTVGTYVILKKNVEEGIVKFTVIREITPAMVGIINKEKTVETTTVPDLDVQKHYVHDIGNRLSYEYWSAEPELLTINVFDIYTVKDSSIGTTVRWKCNEDVFDDLKVAKPIFTIGVVLINGESYVHYIHQCDLSKRHTHSFVENLKNKCCGIFDNFFNV